MVHKKKPIKKQKGTGVYTKVVNKLFNAGLGENEVHAPMWTNEGLKFGSYIGPNTELYKNIRKGKKPVSDTDRVSKAHDLRYDRATKPSDVRDADVRMLKKLKQIRKDGTDFKINTYIGEIPIRVKMMAENLGIAKPGSFSTQTGVLPENRKLNKSELKKLEQQGFGKKQNPWNIHVAKIKRANPNLSFKEILILSSKSYKKK
jgi:hypothetical protein